MPNFTESLPELFDRVAEAPTRDEKLHCLRLFKNTRALHTILQGAFNPDIVWDLPTGKVPYKREDAEYGLCPSTLENELRRLPYFVVGSDSYLERRPARERVFIEMLERIHPTESDLLIQMVNKTIKCEGLTAHLVFEYHPQLFGGIEPADDPTPAPKKSGRASKKE